MHDNIRRPMQRSKLNPYFMENIVVFIESIGGPTY